MPRTTGLFWPAHGRSAKGGFECRREDVLVEPSKRRWRLRTIRGLRLPSRLRGALILTGPCAVECVFGVDPLR